MPARIVVELEPAHPKAVAPPHTGPAVHAAFLNAVETRFKDPETGLSELSQTLHDQRYKPFTLTPLLDSGDRPPQTPGCPARFEVGVLADDLVVPVLVALEALRDCQIGGTAYAVTAVAPAAAMSYEDIAASARPVTRWTFDVITPVSFATTSAQGARRQRPWPDAERVLRNLADRWSAFCGPAELPPQTWEVIAERAEDWDGETKVLSHLVKTGENGKPDVYRRGYVGATTFQLAQPRSVPDPLRRAVDALTRFAEFAGFGDRTAVGMGHVRAR